MKAQCPKLPTTLLVLCHAVCRGKKARFLIPGAVPNQGSTLLYVPGAVEELLRMPCGGTKGIMVMGAFNQRPFFEIVGK